MSRNCQIQLLLLIGSFIIRTKQELSEECLAANAACEKDVECIYRLAFVQSACTTNRCQPQCRTSVANLYNNRLGRALLRTDLSCLPARHELEICNLMPNKTPLHCNLARLACESDLQCSSKWEVYFSECEAEAVNHDCSERCRRRLQETLSTQQGAVLGNCTCAESEDELCLKLRRSILEPCLTVTQAPKSRVDNSVAESSPSQEEHMDNASKSPCVLPQALPLISLCILLLIGWTFTLY
uniref:GDNF domain-containing protein n=1 Tax=Syphacia muris TaxID=451379 RepID=A0A158R554_9BILA